MTIFRRNGTPAAVPDDDVHGHEAVLTARRNETIGQLSQVRARIAQLEADQADALLEGRFADHAAAADLLESARTECNRLEAAAAALLAAQQECNAERQKLDMQTRIEECKKARDGAGQRARQIMADLPVCIAEAQALARAAQHAEGEYIDAEIEMRTLAHHLVHFGEASYAGPPRIAVASPVGAEWGRHPEYQALANGNWFIGVANPSAPR